MVSINYSNREVNCKIVYYGPGLSGKTTNLQYVHAKVPKKTRGDLISLATDADRTLYFDFLPINIGAINGFATKFQLYTVPGQVFYNATRKLVLRGVDGLVFVADSQRSKKDENIESLNNLKENLIEYGYDINTLPIVLQFNKRDLPEAMSIEELQKDLNWNNLPYFEASAVKGVGVFDTLKMITKLVLNKAKKSESPAVPEAAAAATLTIPAMLADPAAMAVPAELAAVGNASDHETYVGGGSQSGSTTIGTTVVGPTPLSTDRPRRIEVREVTDECDWGTREAASDHPSATAETTTPAAAKRPSLAEIESKLHLVDNRELDTIKDPTVNPRTPDDETARSQFADAFEVPRVVGMQRSLKTKKIKKRFFLFRWFSGNKD
jgi:signal recognition particle receptor subunit beta